MARASSKTAPAKKTRTPKAEAAPVEVAPTKTRKTRQPNPDLVAAKRAFQQKLVELAQSAVDKIDESIGNVENTVRTELMASIEDKVQAKVDAANKLLAAQREAAEKKLAAAQAKLDALPALEEA